MKDIKIKIQSEEHARKVHDHLFSLGYEWDHSKGFCITSSIKCIATIDKRITWVAWEYIFNELPQQEVELVTEVEGGKVCTYFKLVIKEIPKKKFEFKANNGYLLAVDEKDKIIVYLINLLTMRVMPNAKLTLEGAGYDTTGYEWDKNGSIKILR